MFVTFCWKSTQVDVCYILLTAGPPFCIHDRACQCALCSCSTWLGCSDSMHWWVMIAKAVFMMGFLPLKSCSFHVWSCARESWMSYAQYLTRTSCWDSLLLFTFSIAWVSLAPCLCKTRRLDHHYLWCSAFHGSTRKSMLLQCLPFVQNVLQHQHWICTLQAVLGVSSVKYCEHPGHNIWPGEPAMGLNSFQTTIRASVTFVWCCIRVLSAPLDLSGFSGTNHPHCQTVQHQLFLPPTQPAAWNTCWSFRVFWQWQPSLPNSATPALSSFNTTCCMKHMLCLQGRGGSDLNSAIKRYRQSIFKLNYKLKKCKSSPSARHKIAVPRNAAERVLADQLWATITR